MLIIHVLIYIPPCIYLNEFSDQDWIEGEFIYIPPCIYLNHMPVKPKNVCTMIYIPPCIYLNLVCTAVRQTNHSYLHSTMYLFKHRVRWNAYNRYSIYIPPCIYLNPAGSAP